MQIIIRNFIRLISEREKETIRPAVNTFPSCTLYKESEEVIISVLITGFD